MRWRRGAEQIGDHLHRGLSGKSTIVRVIDAPTRSIPRVGVFRSIARSTSERDYVLEMLLDHIGVDLDYDEAVGVTYDEVRHDPDAALSKIVERFKAVEVKVTRSSSSAATSPMSARRASSATTPASPRTSAPPCSSANAPTRATGSA